MHSRSLYLVLFLLLGACAQKPVAHAATPSDESFLTLLDNGNTHSIYHLPACAVGDTYDAQYTSETIATVLMDASQPADSETQTTKIAGSLQITGVDSKQHPTSYAITISTCTGAKGEALIAPGKIVDVNITDKGPQSTLRNGPKLEPNALEMLDGIMLEVLFPADPQRPLPRKIGDSWPMTMASGDAGVPQAPAGGAVTDAHGTATLKSIQVVHDVRALELESIMAYKMKMPGLPPGVHADQADMKMTLVALVPIDGRHPPIQTSTEMESHIKVGGSFLFIPVHVNTTITMHRRLTLTPTGNSATAKPE